MADGDVYTWSEHMVTFADKVVPMSPSDPTDITCLVGCAVLTGAGAVLHTAKVAPGQSVAVFGAGGVGLSAIAAAAIAGADPVIAVDLVDRKLQFAREFGATHVVNAAEADPVAAIWAINPGGVDFALDAVGAPTTALQILAAREPDQGLWEVRGPAQHFTASKVLCWVAADRGAKLAELRDESELARSWRRAADEIHADVMSHGIDKRGVFCQHYETTALDASALLIPLLGFLPPSDEHVRATVLAIADELTEDELVLRYRVEETDDGFSGEEGTFTICSFWLVSALTEIGEVSRARALCEKLLSYASPLLLYAEEIDPHSGRQLGNFPQAFSHLALINALMYLIREDERLVATTAISSDLDPEPLASRPALLAALIAAGAEKKG